MHVHIEMLIKFSTYNSVSVPPHQILVYDASGRDVAGAVGPLQEDDNLVLVCEVRGGKYSALHREI
jgi:hypothetical protein